MSYESGSLECRKLIEAKENLIKIMQSLESLDDTERGEGGFGSTGK